MVPGPLKVCKSTPPGIILKYAMIAFSMDTMANLWANSNFANGPDKIKGMGPWGTLGPFWIFGMLGLGDLGDLWTFWTCGAHVDLK